MFDSTCTSGGCRSRVPSSTFISFPILEDLRYLRDPIFSFLLLLNKNNNLLKQQDASRHTTKYSLLQGFCNTDFPQSTRNHPSDHEWISLSPRVGSKNRLESGLQKIPARRCRGVPPE